MSIDRASEDTRIRSDYLIRMESDDFGFLAPTYVRGFLRTYARYLHIDETPVIEEFDSRFSKAGAASTIAALEERARSAPRPRRRTSSWGVAAALAAVFLIALAVVGQFGGDETNPNETVTRENSTDQPETDNSTTNEPDAGPDNEPSPDKPKNDDRIAFKDGIELEIVAASGECWVDVTADGVNVLSETLAQGTRRTVSADEDMDVVLGLPESVELVVNGHNLGSPGGQSPVTISLPEDIDSLTSL